MGRAGGVQRREITKRKAALSAWFQTFTWAFSLSVCVCVLSDSIITPLPLMHSAPMLSFQCRPVVYLYTEVSETAGGIGGGGVVWSCTPRQICTLELTRSPSVPPPFVLREPPQVEKNNSLMHVWRGFVKRHIPRMLVEAPKRAVV